jgi:hypothetical protein
MPLLLNQMVRVRVAVVLEASDLSVGQVYDEETAAWTDLVWIDLANSTALPLEFGDVEFWGEVGSLALTRNTVTRPAVRLRAWAAGGVKAETYQITTSGSALNNQATIQRAGADLSTNLPGLGPVLNTVRIYGFRDARVGWTGRMPDPICWNRTYLAIRKRIRYEAASSYEMEYLCGVSGCAGDLAAFNAWLATNQPEYPCALTIGGILQFSRTQNAAPWVYRYRYVAPFTIHAQMAFDGSYWYWSARGALTRLQSTEVTSTICGGGSITGFYGDTYAPDAANAAYLMSSLHGYGTMSGSFTTPPAGGGTVTASPRGAIYNGGPSYGLDCSITVSALGRITDVALAGFTSDGTVESVTGWGACKQEGGVLA